MANINRNGRLPGVVNAGVNLPVICNDLGRLSDETIRSNGRRETKDELNPKRLKAAKGAK